MRTFIPCAVFLTLALTAWSTESTASIISSAFHSNPVKVFDVSNSTDLSTWNGIQLYFAFYGAGTSNDTIYAWGVALSYDSSSGLYSMASITKRTINATIAAEGTDTSLACVAAADAVITVSDISFSPLYAYATAAGGNYVAAAWIADSGTTQVVKVAVIAANTSVLKTTTVKTASATVSTVNYAIGNMWYEDGYFYLIWAQQDTSGSSTTENILYLNAVNAFNGSLLYTTEVTVATGLGVSASSPGRIASSARAAGSSNTYSDYVLVSYKSSANELKFVKVNRTAGTVASTETLKTDDSSNTYTPVGFISSLYTYAVVVSTTNSDTSTTYNLTAFFNGSTTESTLSLTFTDISLFPQLMYGGQYFTGYYVVAYWRTSSGWFRHAFQTYYANGTVNTTQTTIGDIAIESPDSPPTRIFTDTNGAVWFGYNIFDTDTGFITRGYVGKLFAQTKEGSILINFVVFLCTVMISLFMV